MTEERKVCRTPTPDSQPTRIPVYKFDLVRKAILQTLPQDGSPIATRDALARVRCALEEEAGRIGSIGWHFTTVRLEMEVAGEIERLSSVRPQQLRKKV